VKARQLGPLWLTAVVLAIYLPDVGQGFIKDDFAWIGSSRLERAADLWGYVAHPASGFFRPLVALTFGLDALVFGLHPLGYGLTNLALVGLCAAGVWRLAGALGLASDARLVAAAIWALNFHGINLSVLWISGRTALLLCACAVWAADALVRGRPIRAGVLALAAMLSKEEAVALPVVFAIWLAILPPSVDAAARSGANRWRAVVAGTWPTTLALAISALLRLRTSAMTFATAPGVYQARLDAGRFVDNLLEYLDRSSTGAVAVALAACLLAWRRPRLDAPARRTLAIAAAWFAGLFAITVWLPVRSSLYAVTPAVASAMAAALVVSRTWDDVGTGRRRIAVAVALVLPVALWPIYHLRNQRLANEARLSAAVLRDIAPLGAVKPPLAGVVVVDDPRVRPSLYQAFGPHLPDAVALTIGRSIPVSLDNTPEPGLALPIPDGPATRRFRLENGRLIDAR
jgi:hypothetical protein